MEMRYTDYSQGIPFEYGMVCIYLSCYNVVSFLCLQFSLYITVLLSYGNICVSDFICRIRNGTMDANWQKSKWLDFGQTNDIVILAFLTGSIVPSLPAPRVFPHQSSKSNHSQWKANSNHWKINNIGTLGVSAMDEKWWIIWCGNLTLIWHCVMPKHFASSNGKQWCDHPFI